MLYVTDDCHLSGERLHGQGVDHGGIGIGSGTLGNDPLTGIERFSYGVLGERRNRLDPPRYRDVWCCRDPGVRWRFD